MDKATEISLMGELRDLARDRHCFLDDEVGDNAVYKYSSASHFAAEQERFLKGRPRIVAHSSELPSPDSFLRMDVAGLPVLLTRDSDGVVRAFINVCRHRGARLVDDERGCRGRFTCPYHAWSFSNRGELLNIPFGEQGFPDLDKATLGLKVLACEERYGWIWLSPRGETLEVDAQLGGLAPDFVWLDAGSLEVKASHQVERKANWKILIEGGIEAYHFRIVHRNTIGPHFPNNLSSYQCFGDNLRSILPRAGIADIALEELEVSSIRDRANVLYTLFPNTAILVMPDHLVWIHQEPVAADRTLIRISTLGPKDSDDAAHWARNNAITQATLAEDGEIGESIQVGIDAGANEVFRFGRFEGALGQFNATIDRYLAPR